MCMTRDNQFKIIADYICPYIAAYIIKMFVLSDVRMLICFGSCQIFISTDFFYTNTKKVGIIGSEHCLYLCKYSSINNFMASLPVLKHLKSGNIDDPCLAPGITINSSRRPAALSLLAIRVASVINISNSHSYIINRQYCNLLSVITMPNKYYQMAISSYIAHVVVTSIIHSHLFSTALNETKTRIIRKQYKSFTAFVVVVLKVGC